MLHTYNMHSLWNGTLQIILNSYDSNVTQTYIYISVSENLKDTDSQKRKIHFHSFLPRSNKLYKTPNIVYKMRQI